VAQTVRRYGRIADGFVRRVLSGAFPCGRLFRAAVERSVRERKKGVAGYEFRPALADRACEFVEALKLPGEGPKRGTPFVLEPWQVWLVREFAGWVDSATGYRRWRFATIWVAKGNGKSPLAGALALYALEADDGAKVYSAATTQQQARLCWEAAQDMLRLDPDMADDLGLWVGEHNIKGKNDARVYEPISSEHKSVEGKRPSFGIIDELHLAADNRLFGNFKSACDKVDGSTLLTISTAGFGTDTTLPGLRIYNRAVAILEGKADEPETFALVAGADEGDDPWVEATWRKANPNLGISVSLAGLRAAASTAREDGTERGTFLTKHLNLWQQSQRGWLPPGQFQACAVPGLKLEDFKGKRCWVGLDLGRTSDLSAKALLFPDGAGSYALFVHGYVTETMARSHPLYGQWVAEGRLTITPGPAIDHASIEADVVKDSEMFRVVEVDYDPTFAAYLATRLHEEHGLEVVSIPSRREYLSAGMNEAERLILSKSLRYPEGDTLTEWFFANVLADVDRGGRPFPVKESADSPKKIDGAVAAITALSRAMVAPAEPEPRPRTIGMGFVSFADLSEGAAAP
jgi:phage terminase large subunit-like protein